MHFGDSGKEVVQHELRLGVKVDSKAFLSRQSSQMPMVCPPEQLVCLCSLRVHLQKEIQLRKSGAQNDILTLIGLGIGKDGDAA